MPKVRPRRRPSRTLAVVGLGYVGLPLACLAAEKGWYVIGIGRDRKKLSQIARGISPIKDPGLQRWLRRVAIETTDDLALVQRASVIAICVPTPVDEHNTPDFSAVKNAARGIGRSLRRGQLVIVESTVSPGACQEIVRPLLERSSGLRAGRDFSLAHCPERIDPGSTDWTVRNIPRVVGGIDPVSLRKAMIFYRNLIEAPIRAMHSIQEAEAVKILENSFRDVNIAFVNEIARSFERMGIDTVDVIRGAATKPFAFLPHYPSAGVGGHCIPVDPYYLIERARKGGFDHAFLKLARRINNSMPGHAIERLKQALREQRLNLRNVTVGVLGLAYKKNISDTRESPTYSLLAQLKGLGADYEVFDPRVRTESTVDSLEHLLDRSDALVLMTDHDEFMKITPQLLTRHRVKAVVDGKNVFDKQRMTRARIAYRGIGR